MQRWFLIGLLATLGLAAPADAQRYYRRMSPEEVVHTMVDTLFRNTTLSTADRSKATDIVTQYQAAREAIAADADYEEHFRKLTAKLVDDLKALLTTPSDQATFSKNAADFFGDLLKPPPGSG